MSDTTTDFFDNIGGSGAPGALLKTPGDYVKGEILELFKTDFIPFGKKDPEPDSTEPDGKRKKLVITIQTDNRNWANVVKVPRIDPSDPDSAEKAPEEDDGRRSIHVPNRSNIQWAIGKAVAAAKAQFEVGGTLGVKIDKLTDTGKGNPLKEHVAVYQAKAASDGFFPPSQPAQAAPAPAAEPTPAPAAPAAPAASQDPWATSSTPATDEPPF